MSLQAHRWNVRETFFALALVFSIATGVPPADGQTRKSPSEPQATGATDVFRDVDETLDQMLRQLDQQVSTEAAGGAGDSIELSWETETLRVAILPVQQADEASKADQEANSEASGEGTSTSAAGRQSLTSEPQSGKRSVSRDTPAASSRSESAATEQSAVPADASTRSLTVPRSARLLQRPIERALQVHFRQRLNTNQHSCWSIMHAFLGWGPQTEIHVGSPRGRRVNAIQWVGTNQPCAGRRLLYFEDNRIRGRLGPGYQGHPGQFLAMLAQSGVDPSFELAAEGRTFRVSDLVAEEQRTCASGTELTFKLLGLSHYASTIDSWTSDEDGTWSVERLLAAELGQPINGVACGGTHRLMAISYAVAKRQREGLPSNGTWKTAEQYIRDYHRYTLTLTNRDGSFSSDWFRRRADWGDIDRRLQTTGHILEWLVFSLPDDKLFDSRVSRAVNFLANALTQHRHHDWELGPKGHAIRALRLYHQRVFQQVDFQVAPIARQNNTAATAR